MLRFNLEFLLRSKGIKNGFTHLKINGFSQSSATKYCRGDMSVLRLKDVEKICELFHCTPNELLEWYPDAAVKNIENHPLFSLKKKEVMANVSKGISTLKIDELEQVEKFITDLKSKKNKP